MNTERRSSFPSVSDATLSSSAVLQQRSLSAKKTTVMDLTKDTYFRNELRQLECHFTWDLRREDVDLTDLLNRLEDQIDLKLGKEAGLARSYNSMAFVKYRLGFPQEALSILQKSVELMRESHSEGWEKSLIVTYGNLAWLHLHMEDYTECECDLRKLNDIKDRFPTTLIHPEVLGEKGWTFFKFSREYYDRAKECFKKALEQQPEEGEWNAGYAIALYRTETEDSSPEESPTIKQLRRAIETNPDDAKLTVLLALRLAIYKRFEEAEELVEKALEMSPESPHVIPYVGKFFRGQGALDRSIAILKRALDRTPNSAFIHHQLALCYKKKKVNLLCARNHQSRSVEIQQLRRQCIYHLETATTLKANFVFAMSELALHYGEDKDISRAEELFQRTFKAAKEKNQSQQMISLQYGQFQQFSNKCEPLAIKNYMECLKQGPDTKEGSKAANHLQKIAERRISRSPTDGEAFGVLGFIHKEKGEKQKAIECYEKALLYEANDEYLSNLCELRLSLQ